MKPYPARKKKERPAKPLTRQRLEKMGVGYLQRFPASIRRFRTIMKRKITRAHQRAPGDQDAYGVWLQEVEDFCLRIGLLDDSVLCRGITQSLSRRGHGFRDIRMRLKSRGFNGETIDIALENLDGQYRRLDLDPDVVAAVRYLKRRRFGPFAKATLTYDDRRRQSAALGRRGFSYQVSRTAMEMAMDDAEAMLYAGSIRE